MNDNILKLKKTKPVSNAPRYSTRNENSVDVYDFTRVGVHNERPTRSARRKPHFSRTGKGGSKHVSFKGGANVAHCTLFDQSRGSPCRSTERIPADVACKLIADLGRLKMIRTWVCEKGCTPRMSRERRSAAAVARAVKCDALLTEPRPRTAWSADGQMCAAKSDEPPKRLLTEKSYWRTNGVCQIFPTRVPRNLLRAPQNYLKYIF